MAEVGRPLRSGLCRLSALTNRPIRLLRAAESLAPVPASCSFSSGQIKPGSTRRSCGEVSRWSERGERESEQEPASVSPLVGFVHVRDRLQLVLQARALWTRADVSVRRDVITSYQQLRALCTVVFVHGERSGRHLRGLPDTDGRSFSSSSSTDVPPLYRSRTAYYDILKVTPAATQSQIKTAYYKQSFIYHPDKNPGNEEASQTFSEISEAYTVLGNINLRRKYDRGILSQSDLQCAGRPSSKETTNTSGGSSQQQHRARRFSQASGKTMYDFDAFYQAHYGEQLQRERELRARRQHMEEMRKENLRKWRKAKVVEMTMVVMLTIASLIFIDVFKE